MSENNAAAAQQGPQFAIQRIYTKDLSFEAPNTPAIFMENWEPQINVDLNSSADRLDEGLYDVNLQITVTAKLGDKTAYLVEIKQAGIFAISGFPEQDLGGMLHSYCPNLLFPFAREAISSIISKASFPQMMLAPINFDALYAQHLQQQQQPSDAQH
ncbi:MAG: protein-export chaperone SecB [Chromatiales bacterium]|nr:protein-export chaperone SecB [Gammaproteobacteria bacterium]MBW6477470.1 protein-export chaperone SecB [Chromatiales bacterium]